MPSIEERIKMNRRAALLTELTRRKEDEANSQWEKVAEMSTEAIEQELRDLKENK